MAVNKAAVVAHLISKKHFPSVATHEANKVYLCDQCHHILDNGNAAEIQAMKCFPLIIERLTIFYPLILEKKPLPKCFDNFVKTHDNAK